MKDLPSAVLGAALAIAVAGAAAAQAVTFTTEQDHQNMMDQLGVHALRPAPSGNEKAPDHANYDEAKANPYPDYPDALTLDDGRKVTTADRWWSERRPQILEAFSREVLGRVPNNVPTVTWRVVGVDHERVGFMPVVATKLVGHVDNSAYPAIKVDLQMTLVLPENVTKPVPVLMMIFPRNDYPNPAQPSQDELDRINAAIQALLVRQDPSLKAVFDAHPAYEIKDAAPPFPPRQLNADGDPPNAEQLIADGWGYVLIDPTSAQADDGAGLTRGIIGLVNKGQPRKPEDWGALRAWAWAASRGLDYLQTLPAVDGKRVGIEGVSRYGKAALVTMAYDQRFAVGLIGSSGEGGVKPYRRNWGESVENLANAGGYHWMAGNFLKYGASDAVFGSRTANDLPVDSNELIALCAPRPTFVSFGVPEQGDAKWLDHQGSFMATVDAGAVWRLLGARDLGVTQDYHTAKMPPVNVGLLDGQLAWRQHDGGHTDAPNMKWFLMWADKTLGHAPPAS